MSSTARAERRRQERAAAKAPADYLPRIPVWQREGGDCLRAAVAGLLAIPYEETPGIDGHTATVPEFDAGWRAWAAARGLRFRHFESHCPTRTGRWIAQIDGHDGSLHAVVMSRDQLAFDPGRGVRAVVAADVRRATLLGTPEWVAREERQLAAAAAAFAPGIWEITRPVDGPYGVGYHRHHGQHDLADAMQERIERN